MQRAGFEPGSSWLSVWRPRRHGHGEFTLTSAMFNEMIQLLLHSKVAKAESYLIDGYHNESLELTYYIETLIGTKHSIEVYLFCILQRQMNVSICTLVYVHLCQSKSIWKDTSNEFFALIAFSKKKTFNANIRLINTIKVYHRRGVKLCRHATCRCLKSRHFSAVVKYMCTARQIEFD